VQLKATADFLRNLFASLIRDLHGGLEREHLLARGGPECAT
jgi:hypothetical protein